MALERRAPRGGEDLERHPSEDGRTEQGQAKSQPISKEQVWAAWKHVRKGGKARGVDGVSIDMIDQAPAKYLYPLWNRLASGSYQPPAVREHAIPKGDGKERKLGIPTVTDRVAQQVIRSELEEEVEQRFHPSSFGYRPKRGAHDALDECVRQCHAQWYVIDLDIRGFFDAIDHERMMGVLRKHTDKRHVLLYCERWLKARVQRRGGEIEDRDTGTPQGGVISPLLANLYLHEAFDQWIGEAAPGARFERYADDIVVHVRTEAGARRLLDLIRERLREYSLELSEAKTRIVYCWRKGRPPGVSPDLPRDFDFVGFTLRPRYIRLKKGGSAFWWYLPGMSRKSETRISHELRRLRIHRWQSVGLKEIATWFAPKLRGWIGYYGYRGFSVPWRLMRRMNVHLIQWVRRKFSLQTHGAAYYRLRRICQKQPNLFYHWSKGYSV